MRQKLRKFTLDEYIHALSEGGGLISSQTDNKTGGETVEHISYDNRDVGEGTLFICKGMHFREQYLQAAKERGAFCYVSERVYPGCELPCVLVEDVRRAIPVIAKKYYANACDDVFSVGVTGTKGKSTTVYYIKSILDLYAQETGGAKAAVISSIDTYDGVELFESHLTTPEPIELHRHFYNARESGIQYLVTEVSSQALKYGRVSGLTLGIGCFLNMGEDHISSLEHPDYEDYFAAKLKILDISRFAVIGSNQTELDRTVSHAREAGVSFITFGYRPEDDVFCSDVRKQGEATCFHVRTPSGDDDFCLTMPGLFNVDNALCAIAVCGRMGIPTECIKRGLACARSSGRMETFYSNDRRVLAIVDYAHNKMSFEALFESVAREYPDRAIIAVYGTAGNKAQIRRRDLSLVAGRYSHHIYVTEEDSGEEPFMNIASEIAANIETTGCPYTICEDRGEAIRSALLEHEGNTVVLITGKGRETRQKRGTEYIDVPSDVDYVQKYLESYNKAKIFG